MDVEKAETCALLTAVYTVPAAAEISRAAAKGKRQMQNVSFDPTFYFRLYPQENSKPWTQVGGFSTSVHAVNAHSRQSADKDPSIVSR